MEHIPTTWRCTITLRDEGGFGGGGVLCVCVRVCVCVCVLWEKGGKKNSLEHKIYVFDITAMHDGVNARG